MLSVGKIPHKVVVGLEPNLDTTLGHDEDFLVGFDDLFLHFTAVVQDTWWWLGSGVNSEFFVRILFLANYIKRNTCDVKIRN